jgi:transcription initiation factor IIE alpha subunit
MAKKKRATLNARDEIMLELFKRVISRLDMLDVDFDYHIVAKEMEDKGYLTPYERQERERELMRLKDAVRRDLFAVYRRRLIALEKREKKLSEKS